MFSVSATREDRSCRIRRPTAARRAESTCAASGRVTGGTRIFRRVTVPVGIDMGGGGEGTQIEPEHPRPKVEEEI